MNEGDTFEVDGQEYLAVTFSNFRCANCKRVTQTSLCGCGNPNPEKSGDKLVGLPVSAIDRAFALDKVKR